MHIRSVLFVGRRNAARSVMAEICFNAASIPTWRAFSAGWQPVARVDRPALRALAEDGFPADPVTPKTVDIFRQPGAPSIDLCVFLDTELPDDITSYPGRREFWQIPDPSKAGLAKIAYRDALATISGRMAELILSGRLTLHGDLPLAS